MSEALMQVILIYFFYIGLASLLFLMIVKLLKLKNKVIGLIYVLALISPLLLYIPVEINTYLYGNEFKDVNIYTGFNSPVIYYKVFSINENKAKVFFVEGKSRWNSKGSFYYFIKENSRWTMEKCDIRWTNLGGSASEFTIPPYF